MVNQAQVDATKLYLHALGRKTKEGREFLPGLSRMRAQYQIAEAVASGQFPVQIAPLVRRQLQQVFADVPTEAGKFATQHTVLRVDTDEQFNIYTFDDQQNLTDNGGDTFVPGGLPQVGRRQRYQQIGLTASGKTVRASKVGEGFGIDWEAIVNSRGAEVNLIDDAVNAFGRHAKNQEDISVVKQFATPGGFSAALTASANHIAGNPDLSSVTTIRDAIATALQTRVGASGNFLGQYPNYERFVLLVSPAYQPYVQQVIDARTVTLLPPRTGDASTSVGATYTQQINLGAQVDVIGWRWLQRVFPNIGKGWILLPVPAADDLPVVTQNRLQGFEQPQFFVRDSNALAFNRGGTAGAEMDPFETGDFDEDAVVTKVRHVIGANLLWGEAIQYSTGANA